MLVFKSVLVFLLSFILKDIKCEELVNNTTTTEIKSETIPLDNVQVSTTEFSLLEDKEFISLTLDNITANDDESSINKSSKKDLNSQILEDLQIPELTTSSTATTTTSTPANEYQDNDTTSSWELIYPDQNSSAVEQVFKPPTTELPASNLPKYFKVDDTNNCQKYFSTCLKQVLSNVVPKLKDGNKYLHIPSLDPLYFNSTAFQYNSGPFNGYITIRYALIYGLTTMKFKKIDFQKEGNKFKARFSMLVPKMYALGSYKGDMHVNNVRVRPRGDFNVTMVNLGVEMLTLGSIIRKDDHTFLKLTKNNATTTLKESKINATGIFPDQRLNDIVLNVANQYSRDLFNIVLPETRNNWLPILRDTLNGALAMVPFDFLK